MRETQAVRPVPTGGLWVDLLGDLAGRRVLVPPGTRPEALTRLTGAGACVRHRVGPWLDGGDGPGWDVVVAGPRFARAGFPGDLLAPDGTLVLVARNPVSPLAGMDAVRARPGRTAPSGSLGRIRSELRARGLLPAQVFGLLRSAAEPVTAFDLDAPGATRAVLAASRVHVGGGRGAALRALQLMAGRRGLAELVPGWLVIAGRDARPPEPDRITGMIANRDSREVKLVRGEPPSVLDKRYGMRSRAAAEAEALQALTALGLAIAPQLLRRPAADAVWMQWRSGRPLVPEQLDAGELVAWTERAARVLVGLQRATRRGEQVLVHGDFWLGNLLTSGDRIVAVIDWTKSGWGPVSTDREFLLDQLPPVDPRLRDEVRTRCAAIFAADQA